MRYICNSRSSNSATDNQFKSHSPTVPLLSVTFTHSEVDFYLGCFSPGKREREERERGLPSDCEPQCGTRVSLGLSECLYLLPCPEGVLEEGVVDGFLILPLLPDHPHLPSVLFQARGEVRGLQGGGILHGRMEG